MSPPRHEVGGGNEKKETEEGGDNREKRGKRKEKFYTGGKIERSMKEETKNSCFDRRQINLK